MSEKTRKVFLKIQEMAGEFKALASIICEWRWEDKKGKLNLPRVNQAVHYKKEEIGNLFDCSAGFRYVCLVNDQDIISVSHGWKDTEQEGLWRVVSGITDLQNVKYFIFVQVIEDVKLKDTTLNVHIFPRPETGNWDDFFKEEK